MDNLLYLILGALLLAIPPLILMSKHIKKTLAEQELEEKKQILKEINQTFNKKARGRGPIW
jgi:hypothetical protein